MSPRKHGKRYQGSYRDETGRRHFVTFETKGELVDALAEKRLEAKRRGLDLPSKPEELPPIPRLVEEYEAALKARKLTPRYVKLAMARLRYMVGNLFRLDSLTRAVVLERRDALPRSNQTKNWYVQALRAWLRWCEETDRIRSAPNIRVRGLPTRGEHRRRPARTATPEEIGRILEASSGRPVDLVVRIALGTGLRVREILGLTWISWKGGSLRVGADAAGNLKSRRAKAIPVPPWLSETLQTVRERRGPVGGRDDRPIVLSGTGLAMTYNGADARIYRQFRSALKAAGVEHRTAEGVLHVHALRHTMAAGLLGAGATNAQVAAALGHASVSHLDPYAHLDGELARRALENLPEPGARAVPQDPHETLKA